MFGNAHRLCKHYPNIVNNSLHHIDSFFLLFCSDFLDIFPLLTIFENVHRPCKQYPNIVNNSLHHVCSFFPEFLTIFTSITILGNAHRPCKQFSNMTTPSLFFSYFFFSSEITKFAIFGNFLVFILVTGFQCHSVPVNSGDCSSEITRISKFCGRSEILAGKFCWNGTRIHRNDWITKTSLNWDNRSAGLW